MAGAVLLFVVAVLAAGLGPGAGAVAAAACDPPDGTGYIEGTFRTMDGDVLDDVVVSYSVVDVQRNETVTGGETSNGEYTVAIQSGDYLVRASVEGYEDHPAEVCVEPNGTVTADVLLDRTTSETPTPIPNATTDAPTDSPTPVLAGDETGGTTASAAGLGGQDGGFPSTVLVVGAGLIVVVLGGVWRLRSGDDSGAGSATASDSPDGETLGGDRDQGWTDSDDGAAVVEAGGGSATDDEATVVQPATDGGPPDQVPGVPNVSVDYAALSDEEPIGGGGNADVVRARMPTEHGGVDLAIKTPRMSGTLHAEAVDRLLEEAETWAKLDDHDHVVGLVDYGSEPLPWIAMEYMDGGHLGERAGAMSLPQALWTAIAITRGVRHAHRRGVAHLDLKPANVLFRSVEDAWDPPKVADWGLSKHLLNHSASVEGLSPQYAAPEQFDNDLGPVDDITDVYQLGALFYELFTGRPPFQGNATEVMREVPDEEPTPPSEIVDLPAALDDVLLTALATRKDDRYESVLLLRNDLQKLIDDE